MPEGSPVAAPGTPRGSLFRRYTLYLALLLSLAVLVSGGISVYFAYRDTRALIDDLQREKARAAAARIGQFIQIVQLQVQGAAISGRGGTAEFGERHIELVRLLRIAPSISDAAWLDAAGHERVRVSRLAHDVVGSDIDRSAEPAVIVVRAGGTAYGEIRFRRQSEPHLEIAVPGTRRDDGVVIADINLKFASDVVAGLHLGEGSKAYVVDAQGRLIVHSDAAMALRMTSLMHLPQVRAALAPVAASPDVQATVIARVADGPRTIAAHAAIDPPGWHVIVEQPLGVAFAPMFSSLARTAALLLAGIVCAVAASLVLARRMTAPIRMLESGAQRIGEGRLDERVEIRTGDELEGLADQFNRMAQRLRESYAGLERKVEERTRQLEEANRAKTRFLAVASHDLRQPVHALGLFVAQLEETHDEVAVRRLIGKVSASSTAIAELIESLLDISKLDAGTVASQPAEFALQPLFDSMEQAFALAARDKGLRLRIRPTRLRVKTDPVLLERILLNLCGNAVRYTQQGGAILTARRRGSGVRIEVWDTGIGISAGEQQHIFEEFYQLPGGTDTGSKGLGLGLAIVHRLAGLLGLPVSVRSIPERGSVFALDVPLAAEVGQGESAPSPMHGTVQFTAFPVLLIDDDPVAREATEGVLVQWGCEVRSAAGAAEALALWTESAPPRLIICDYRLGRGALGTELVRELRRLAGHDIPAVVVSADVTQALREVTVTAGLYLLHKPLNAARLRALLLHVAGSAGAA